MNLANQTRSELAMPPLGSLSIHSPPQQHPSHHAEPPRQGSYFPSPVPLPVGGPAAHIQSWAGSGGVEQPTPMSPPQTMHGMWTPDAGIKFAGPPAPAGGRGKGPVGGKWEPESGIRFG